MPLSAELRVPVNGKCLAALSQSETIRSALEHATEWEDELRIDVLPLLLLTNVYGRTCEQRDSEAALWKSAESEKLLAEQDLTDPRHRTLIGEWNLPFLRWLKGISTSTKEMFTVYYDHERGDTPYEYVWWVSAPASDKTPHEVFGLASHGGMDEAEWELEIFRFSDGRSQVHESGERDDPPRYLA
jgi:hypothetical protein